MISVGFLPQSNNHNIGKPYRSYISYCGVIQGLDIFENKVVRIFVTKTEDFKEED